MTHIAQEVVIIGAGLAGSQAALTCAKHGLRVTLYEMRPGVSSPAHHTERPAELVCSNSFKSDVCINAAGLLKRELTILGGELLQFARECSVPAGGALAVDREAFSKRVGRALEAHPQITLIQREITSLEEFGDTPIIVAAGPLASECLTQALVPYLGEGLHFFDAAAPIVAADSLDYNRVFRASRYDKGQGDDYLNIALNEEEYRVFYEALIDAERVIKKDFDKNDLFNACQPVEEVARRGYDALRYGIMKPVGIDDPRTGRWPYALIQLRAETKDARAYNLVGFQTNLTWPEQRRVFSLIPGLQQATFERLGVMHRNTFFDAPRLQNQDFSLKESPNLFFAGQITGTEGYTEAVASGLLCALNVVARLKGYEPLVLPQVSAFGALCFYAHSEETVDYQPMHVNFGIIPPLENRYKNKRLRYKHYALRSAEALKDWVSNLPNDIMVSENPKETSQQIIDEIARFEVESR